MKSNGNPVAIAHRAFNNQSTYRINPQFNLRYKLLGKDDQSHQLDLNAEVFMDIYNQSDNTYYPGSLTTNSWSSGVNTTSNKEYKSLSLTNRETLTFTPHFNNEDWSASAMFRFEMKTGSSTSQNISHSGIPTGITSSSADGYLGNTITGTGEWKGMAISLLLTWVISTDVMLWTLQFVVTVLPSSVQATNGVHSQVCQDVGT
jgi:hypothetical protein